MNIYLKSLLKWLSLGVAITFIFGFIFIAAQQVIRNEANGVPIDTAQNVIGYLESDATTKDLINQSTKVDLANSDKTFMIAYDQNENVTASSATLDGATPSIPSGALDQAKKATNKITWSPKNGIREAVVIYAVGGSSPGFLLVGHSLKDTEDFTKQLGWVLFGGWVITILATLLINLGLVYLAERKNNPKPSKRQSRAESAKTDDEIEKSIPESLLPKSKLNPAKMESESKSKTAKMDKDEEMESDNTDKKSKKSNKPESK
jgi:hypothetical protein